MCGLAGAVWTAEGAPLDAVTLDRMTDLLRHRGPDDRGTHREVRPDGSGVALGHRRLSIIDLEGGRQPLSNEDGSIWVVFNGEIYNYRELRADLESAGHRFHTASDTETLVHLYEERGLECLEALRGMFAFALWDRPRQRLLLARDRLGQKPLVYREDRGRLCFASEIKALLQIPGALRELDPISLDLYLSFLYVPHPRTMFAGIHKLPPGHFAVHERGKLSIERYWDPDLESESRTDARALRNRLEQVLDESVHLRLRSDVPLGAFLSGGIDSTAIVGLMQRHLARPTNTYTIGFPVPEYDETSFARAAARHLETRHHEFELPPQSAGILPSLVWHFDEPFADSSAIATWHLARFTREHVKVALTGDGGDELFSGYPRYETIRRLSLFDRLPDRARRLIANPLWDQLPTPNRESSLLRRLQFRARLLRAPFERRYLGWVAQFHAEQKRALYSAELASGAGFADSALELLEPLRRSAARCAPTRAMHTDLQTYLPGDLLAKLDITSMAHGLECRSPFLDHHVVELAASVPYPILRQGKGSKPFLTSTVPDLIPPALRNRPKAGFRVPLDPWFRGPLRPLLEDTLLGRRSLSRGYFRPDGLRALVAEHLSGRWSHGNRLWALVCLELWHRSFVDPAEPPAAPRTELVPDETLRWDA